jgi:hypothetical protein
MVALGIRADRPGISVVDLPPLSLADANSWVVGGGRAGGADFVTTLPGGELDQLYSVVTLGEVLTLAARVFATVEREPGLVGPIEHAQKPSGGGATAERISPSLLAFRRIGDRGGVRDSTGDAEVGQ